MIKKLLQKNSHIFITLMFLLSAILVAACGKEKAPLPAPSKPPVQPSINAVVQPKPVQQRTSSALRIPPPLVNQFDFSNKKDPLKPFLTVKTEPKAASVFINNRSRNSLPIHSFDVNQFKLIGIISGGRENKAMVTDPGGKGYVLKVGMLIGKNDGRIISINASGVNVQEQFKDDTGRVRKENIKLTLPRKQ